MPEKQLFNIHEVSIQTGISVTTLRNHLRLGKFKATKKDNRYLFTQKEIDSYLAKPEIQKSRAEKVQSIMDLSEEAPYSISDFYKQYNDLVSNGGSPEQQLEYLKRHRSGMIYALKNEISHLDELKDLLEKEDYIGFNLKF